MSTGPHDDGGEPEPAEAHEQPGRGRRRHRRVVALSAVDRRRLAAGEIDDPVEALHTADDAPLRASDEPAADGGGGNDARLLRDVPPHWGRR